jgi:hypothetical protein
MLQHTSCASLGIPFPGLFQISHGPQAGAYLGVNVRRCFLCWAVFDDQQLRQDGGEVGQARRLMMDYGRWTMDDAPPAASSIVRGPSSNCAAGQAEFGGVIQQK